MTILKCKMCGGDIELSADKTFGTCEFCGSTMTFPKVDDEQRAAAFNRGNHFRRTGEFDKALAVYERIIQEDEDDAEAHWCCALCRFGIEYVEDPNTFEYLPTCHRASFDSFLEDPDYLAALEHSDGITRRQYQKDAAKIAEVQRGILATSQNEEPFDVFICYKESENDGSRTRDSLYAQDIYYQLTEQGRRVFFSRITLEDKAGTEYEPYIFAALNSARVMILVTTSAEHANAVWVKNEWSRFLSLMRKDRTKLLLPCYRDMDPYDLPEALSVLQSYDMSKIGFIQDLIRGVNKVLNAVKPKAQTVKETVVVQQQSGYAAPLLERAFIFLEDGDWAKADEFCEQVLNLEPKNALAYLGKLMAELCVRKREALKDQPQPFDASNNYRKALRFGDDKLKQELTGAVAFINDRNENDRKEGIYQKAFTAIATRTEQGYREAADLFGTIPEYKDAKAQSEACAVKAEEARKESIYAKAAMLAQKHTEPDLTEAIRLFRSIPNWRQAGNQIAACEKRIEEIRARQEAERVEAERKAETERQAADARKQKNKQLAVILAAVAAVTIAIILVVTKVIIPNREYNKAIVLYESGQYEEAIAAFEALNGYKDSETRTLDCRYGIAKGHYATGKYEEAITAFEILNGYKDSAAQIEACKTAITEQQYNAAKALYAAGDYEKAITTFEALNGYKDSAAQIEACQIAIKDQEYDYALSLYNAGQYEEAIAVFDTLDGYKNTTTLAKNAKGAIQKQKDYTSAIRLMETGNRENMVRAYMLFKAMPDYSDSSEKADRCMESVFKEAITLYEKSDFKTAFEVFDLCRKMGYSEIESKEYMDKCNQKYVSMINMGEWITLQKNYPLKSTGGFISISKIEYRYSGGKIEFSINYSITKYKSYTDAFVEISGNSSPYFTIFADKKLDISQNSSVVSVDYNTIIKGFQNKSFDEVNLGVDYQIEEMFYDSIYFYFHQKDIQKTDLYNNAL